MFSSISSGLKSVESLFDQIDQTAASKLANLTKEDSHPTISLPPSFSATDIVKNDEMYNQVKAQLREKKTRKKERTQKKISLETPSPKQQNKGVFQTAENEIKEELPQTIDTLPEEKTEEETEVERQEKAEKTNGENPADSDSEIQPQLDSLSVETPLNQTDKTEKKENEEDEEDEEDEKEIQTEMENRILKSQLRALSDEMSTLTARVRGTQEALEETVASLRDVQREVAEKDRQLTKYIKKENDFDQVLDASEEQHAQLQIQLEEAYQDLNARNSTIALLQETITKLTKDKERLESQYKQKVELLEDTVKDLERKGEEEKSAHTSSKAQANERERALQNNLTEASAALSSLQRSLEEKLLENQRLTAQLKTSQNEVKNQQKELTDYQKRANKVLESKEKTIKELTEQLNDPSNALNPELTEAQASLSQAKALVSQLQEQLATATKDKEVLSLSLEEMKDQTEVEVSEQTERVKELEEIVEKEKKKAALLNSELQQKNKDIQQHHEQSDLLVSSLRTQIELREQEIKKIKRQLSAKSLGTSSQLELENQLRNLTEHLLQKQSLIDTLTSEKAALLFRFEQERKSGTISGGQSNSQVAIQMEPPTESTGKETRARMRSILSLAPDIITNNNEISRKVEKAANFIDSTSTQFAKVLRTSPQLRLFLLLYAIIVHFWILLLLFSFSYAPTPPEILPPQIQIINPISIPT